MQGKSLSSPHDLSANTSGGYVNMTSLRYPNTPQMEKYQAGLTSCLFISAPCSKSAEAISMHPLLVEIIKTVISFWDGVGDHTHVQCNKTLTYTVTQVNVCSIFQQQFYHTMMALFGCKK